MPSRVVVLWILLLSVASSQAPDATVPATSAPSSATPGGSAGGPPPMENVEELRGRISAAQRQQLDEAMKDFSAAHYAEAITLLDSLREKHPRDPVLAKFTGEALLNTGDTASAMSILNPLAEAGTNDWQVIALLARACAEAGNIACRDREITQMLALHTQGLMPANVKDYPLEHVKIGTNTMIIFSSLEPWGPYKIYAMGKVTNADGKLFLTATIESSDFDQPGFAKEHPKEAAQGVRRYSLDGYAETGLNTAGQRTQTHYTFAFFDGQPSYDTIRANFLKIASGKASALSSRAGLIVP